MATKKTKRTHHDTFCPICLADAPADQLMAPYTDGLTLKLDISSGKYRCDNDHEFTMEELREAMDGGSRGSEGPPETAESDRPVLGHKTVESEAAYSSDFEPENTAQNTQIEAVLDAYCNAVLAASEAIGDDQKAASLGSDSGQLKTIVLSNNGDAKQGGSEIAGSHLKDDLILLPNGDLVVPVIIPEGLIGPTQELAAAEGKTVAEWLSGNLELWMYDFYDNHFVER